MRIKYLKNKIEIDFVSFKRYIDEFKYKNNKYIRICINNNNKYIREVFKAWREKRKIRTRFIIVDSLEINSYVEHLN